MDSSSSLSLSPPDTIPFGRVFESMPGLFLLLSPSLTIVAASEGSLRATFTTRTEIIGKAFFDVFPEPETTPHHHLQQLPRSLAQVLATGEQHQTEVGRYDLPDPSNPGHLLERYWTITNTPILGDHGEVCYILHESVDVTDEVLAKRALHETQGREQALLAEAQRGRDQIERFLREVPAGICSFVGPDFVYDFVNPTYQQQLFPGKELLGKPLFEAVPEVADQPIAEVLRHVYQTGETVEGKAMLIPLSPAPGVPLQDHYFNFIQQARFDESGAVFGILTFAFDITDLVLARQQVEQTAQALQTLNLELEQRVENRTRELQQAQTQLQEQKDRLEQFFSQAPAAICVLAGPEMVYELVNPRYQQMFPGRELLGNSVLEALPELEENVIWQGLNQVYETGQTLEAREILVSMARNHDGPIVDIYFNYVLQARFDIHGKVDGILVIAHEVTDQVVARQQVEQSETLLHLALEAGNMATFDLDLQTNQTTRSRDHDKLFGYTTNLPEWNMDALLQHMLPEDQPMVLAQFQDSMKTGILRLTPRIRKKDGKLRWLEGQGKVFYGEGRQPVRVIGVVTDVTEKRVAEQQLQILTAELATANRDLAQANRELSEANAEIRTSNTELAVANQQLIRTNVDLDNFIYTASHDLKAPISNIEGLMKNLLEELPAETLNREEVQRVTAMIQASVERFKKTIGNLTEVSKLQVDNNREATAVDLSLLVTEVSLDLEQSIKESGIRLEVDVEGCHTISFSEKNLRSIVYNLLSNAIKYRSSDREATVYIQCTQEPGFAVLLVRDNGLGINPDQERQLFTMFKRFHDHVEGTGIGLYMVKKIIENAGGKITMETQVGKGSTFRVYFPR